MTLAGVYLFRQTGHNWNDCGYVHIRSDSSSYWLCEAIPAAHLAQIGWPQGNILISLSGISNHGTKQQGHLLSNKVWYRVVATAIGGRVGTSVGSGLAARCTITAVVFVACWVVGSGLAARCTIGSAGVGEACCMVGSGLAARRLCCSNRKAASRRTLAISMDMLFTTWSPSEIDCELSSDWFCACKDRLPRALYTYYLLPSDR